MFRVLRDGQYGQEGGVMEKGVIVVVKCRLVCHMSACWVTLVESVEVMKVISMNKATRHGGHLIV